MLGVSAAARSALGIGQTYRFIVEDDLAAGRLVQLLPQYGGAARPFSLLYPGLRHRPQRVRVLIDFLVEKLGKKQLILELQEPLASLPAALSAYDLELAAGRPAVQPVELHDTVFDYYLAPDVVRGEVDRGDVDVRALRVQHDAVVRGLLTAHAAETDLQCHSAFLVWIGLRPGTGGCAASGRSKEGNREQGIGNSQQLRRSLPRPDYSAAPSSGSSGRIIVKSFWRSRPIQKSCAPTTRNPRLV